MYISLTYVIYLKFSYFDISPWDRSKKLDGEGPRYLNVFGGKAMTYMYIYLTPKFFFGGGGGGGRGGELGRGHGHPLSPYGSVLDFT
jgi:hypothetical protein